MRERERERERERDAEGAEEEEEWKISIRLDGAIVGFPNIREETSVE